MIKFYKVSYEQFKKDVYNCGFTYIKENEIKEIYDNIKLPKRATKTSAGYDFYSPFYIDIEKVVRQNLHCHSLYTYEELDKLKSKNKVQNLFDYI